MKPPLWQRAAAFFIVFVLGAAVAIGLTLWLGLNPNFFTYAVVGLSIAFMLNPQWIFRPPKR